MASDLREELNQAADKAKSIWESTGNDAAFHLERVLRILAGRALAAQPAPAGDLLARLKDACETPGGVTLDDRAEPWGCDVGLIREAIAVIQAAQPALDDPVPLNAVRAAIEAVDTGRTQIARDNLRILEIHLRANSHCAAPAGEVPMPEPDIQWEDGSDEFGYPTYSKAHSNENVLAYGDARAAAAGAKVPDYAALKHAAHEWANLAACAAAKRGGQWKRHKVAVSNRDKAKARFLSLLATAPQPAAVKESLTVAQPEAKAGAGNVLDKLLATVPMPNLPAALRSIADRVTVAADNPSHHGGHRGALDFVKREAGMLRIAADRVHDAISAQPKPVESLGRDADDGVEAFDAAEAEYDRAIAAGATERQAWHAALEVAARRLRPQGDASTAERRARELLAAEYDRDGLPFAADCIRKDAMLTGPETRAIRALTAVLTTSPEADNA